MKRLEIILAIVHFFWAAYCNGQTDDVLYAQAKADALMQATLAQAAQPGPSSLDVRPNTAPVAADSIQKLSDRVTALEVRVTMLAARVPSQKATEPTPDQLKRLEALEATFAAQKKQLADAMAKQPTIAAPATKDHVCDCGPNCRCVGTCNCRWAGECLGVPDSRVQTSVLKTAPAPTYEETVWRPRTTTVRYSYTPRVRYYYPGNYAGYYGSGGGSVGGWGGQASSYSGSYSSGTPVYCVDAYGNQVPCN